MCARLRLFGLAVLLGFAIGTPCAAAPETTDPGATVSGLAGGFPRPDADGPPTVVEMGFFVLDVSHIGDVDQEFVVDFRLEARWRDPRVVTAAEAPARAGEVLSLEEAWHPSLILLNQRRIWKRFPDQLVIQADGSMAYGQRFFGTFAAPLDLRRFPFDEQVLKLIAGSNRYGPEEVDIRPFDALMGSLGRFTVPNWMVGEGRFEATAIGIPSLGTRFAAATWTIPVQRGSPYFVWKVIVPLCLIVATLFVFLALAEAVVSTRLARSDVERARRLDRVCRWAVPLAFAGSLVFVLV
jgi:hypothetical protein